MDLNEECLQAVRNGIAKGVQDALKSGYNNPIDKLLASIISGQESHIRTLVGEAFKEALSDGDFRDEVKSGVRTTLARILVQRFGGELEKQVNALKSDPSTRARITCAIEDIVSQTAKA